MVVKSIKKLVNANPLLKSSVLVLDDLICGLKLSFGSIESDSGTIHSAFSPADSVSYIEEVFADYKQYGEIDRFYGVAVEVGPGDNAGVGLLMRLDGCDRIDLIDRFLSRRDAKQQDKIYQALAECHSIETFRLQADWNERELSGINWQIGEASEVYFEKCARKSGEVYDFILSRAVLEHLYDPLGALEQMIACLNPGGKVLHKIDLRDHGIFSEYHHELTFLEIPSPIYRLMVKNAGRPNRIQIHRYRELLERLKSNGSIDYSLLVTHLVAAGDVSPHQVFENIDPDKQRQSVAFVDTHRHKFAKEFEEVSSQDLAVSGCFLVITKK
jgi:SAM-dependent methyltransferase